MVIFLCLHVGWINNIHSLSVDIFSFYIEQLCALNCQVARITVWMIEVGMDYGLKIIKQSDREQANLQYEWNPKNQ